MLAFQSADLNTHDVVIVALNVGIWAIAAVLTDYAQFCAKAKDSLKHWLEDGDSGSETVICWRWTLITQFNLDACWFLWICSVSKCLRQFLFGAERWWTESQDYIFCVGFAIVVLFHFFAESLRRRLPGRDLTHAYYLFVMVLSGLYVAASSEDVLYDSDLVVTPIRFAISINPLKRKYVVAGNLLYEAMAVWKLGSAMHGPCGSNMRGVLLNHAFMTMVLVSCSRTIEQLLMAEKRANARTSIMYAAARRLLDLLCDAVLEVDPDLCLVTDVPRFSAMLFLNDRNSLAGVRLTNFICESNRAKLTTALLGAPACDAPDVGVLNAIFKDSSRNNLKLELYYIYISPAETETMETRYLIGLRESHQTDGSISLLSRLSASSGAAGLQLQRALQEQPQNRSPDESAVSQSWSEAATSVLSRTSLVAVPERMPTTPEVKRTMILELLKQFSIRRRKGNHRFNFGICCTKHSALKSLLRVVVPWNDEPCDKSFTYHCEWQCDACGVLHPRGRSEDGCPHCATQTQRRAEELSERLTEASGIGAALQQEALAAAQACVDGPLPSNSDLGPTGSSSSASASGLCHGSDVSDSSTVPRPQPSAGSSQTSTAAVRLVCEEVLRSWNHVLGRRRCCRKHAAIEHFLELLMDMQPELCDAAFRLHEAWQCRSCGVLHEVVPPDSRCGFCRCVTPTEPPSDIESAACSQEKPTAQVDL
eukprot:TRINITY_DN59666_c0_g1_i2.p1 TRINITY_DN59666_c0_g1~~TRINITY_DN59666_c0_g1_i2.p1  ORF type:complete len:707 (-),score=57.71 TRINITY_DN59666_c0_g1_i2:26-2146(-)